MEETAVIDAKEEEPVADRPDVPPKRLSGAQRKKDNRERVLNDKGVWVLKDGWQPHARVHCGK